jgi:hypothetical protein
MDNRTKASNLVRAFNLAGEIVARSAATAEADIPAVSQTVGELAAAIYQEQNALFEGEELTAEAPASSMSRVAAQRRGEIVARSAATAEAPAAKTGGGGWTGSSGGSSTGDGATDKQIGFAGRLIAEIQEAGGTPDVDIDDVKGLSKSDASDAISKLKEKADDLKSGGPF